MLSASGTRARLPRGERGLRVQLQPPSSRQSHSSPIDQNNPDPNPDHHLSLALKGQKVLEGLEHGGQRCEERAWQPRVVKTECLHVSAAHPARHSPAPPHWTYLRCVRVFASACTSASISPAARSSAKSILVDLLF